MQNSTRRAVLLGLSATTLAACDNSVGSNGSQVIDQRVQSTLDYMYTNFPDSRQIAQQSTGMLVMPLMGEAGILVGGAYGEGALLIDGATVDYYSAAQGSVGLQFGIQYYAHVIFFMTPEALRTFRTSPGWTGGVGAEVTLDTQGATLNADTLTRDQPVITLIFGQTGFIVSASVAGTKYTRILR